MADETTPQPLSQPPHRPDVLGAGVAEPHRPHPRLPEVDSRRHVHAGLLEDQLQGELNGARQTPREVEAAYGEAIELRIELGECLSGEWSSREPSPISALLAMQLMVHAIEPDVSAHIAPVRAAGGLSSM